MTASEADAPNMNDPILTDEAVATLNAARSILSALERHYRYDNDTQDSGVVSEAAHTAQWFLFRVLNVASNYGNATITDDQLHNREPEPQSLRVQP